MKIRRATEADEPVLRELWQEFEHEWPEPGEEGETWDEEWPDVRGDIANGAVYLAEDDDGAVGMARASAPTPRGRSHVNLVHVRPRARRRGTGKALLRACVEDVKQKGARKISLEALWANEPALAVWRHLGFREHSILMHTSVEALEPRLVETLRAESLASTHVQSDDRASIDRALAAFVPRLADPQVTQSEGGWARIAHAVLDDDRSAQARLARELSERLGAVVVALALEQGEVVRFLLHERGRMVDEYLSVPSYYGPIPKGDELALAANPTLVARLTGADAAEIRRVARSGASTAELPPGPELYAEVARVLGLEP